MCVYVSVFCLVCLGESGQVEGQLTCLFRSAFQVLKRRRQQHYLDISISASGRNRRIDLFRLRYEGRHTTSKLWTAVFGVVILQYLVNKEDMLIGICGGQYNVSTPKFLAGFSRSSP